jgi:hypothetical protein
MEPLLWVDLTRSRPLGSVCYLRGAAGQADVSRMMLRQLRSIRLSRGQSYTSVCSANSKASSTSIPR